MIRFFSILVIGFKLAGAQSASTPSASTTAVSPDVLLESAGKRVEEFWEKFSAVACTETITQAKLGNGDKVLAQRTSNFDYLVILQLAGDELTVDESRLLQGQPTKKASDRAMLNTDGLSTQVPILPPLLQNSFQYTLGGTQELRGRNVQEIRFEHIPGHRSPSALQLKGRDYPIEWQGSAWIDLQTGNIDRIAAGLKTSLEDVGLKKLSSEVQYAPIAFQAEKEIAWLPQVAVIEANTEHQHWRNTHMFSKYRKFSVTTDTKVDNPTE